MNTKLIIAHYHLAQAADHANVAHYTHGDQSAYHVGQARDKMIDALSGDTSSASVRQHVLNVIEKAISGSLEVGGVTSDIASIAEAAEAVLEGLLCSALPLKAATAEEEDAAEEEDYAF